MCKWVVIKCGRLASRRRSAPRTGQCLQRLAVSPPGHANASESSKLTLSDDACPTGVMVLRDTVEDLPVVLIKELALAGCSKLSNVNQVRPHLFDRRDALVSVTHRMKGEL